MTQAHRLPPAAAPVGLHGQQVRPARLQRCAARRPRGEPAAHRRRDQAGQQDGAAGLPPRQLQGRGGDSRRVRAGHAGQGGHSHDLNRRAAVVHLISDALVSLAVLLSTLLVGLTGWHWLDPLTAIGVGLAVGYTGIVLIRDALIVLLDAIPAHIDPEQVRQVLLQCPGVEDVHHLHIWGLSTSQVALTAHVSRRIGVVDDMALLHHAKRALAAVGVDHSTIQLEPVP